MSALSNIIIKELRELLTPASILPIIVIALIFGSIGSSMEGIREGFEEQPVLGYINEDNNNLSKIVTTYLNNNSVVIFNSTDIADKSYGLDQVKQKEGVALIIIKQNFSRNILNDTRGEIDVYWIMRGAGLLDTVSSEVVGGIISSLRKISKLSITALFPGSARVRENPAVELVAKISYLEDLGEQVLTLYQKGRSVNSIVRELCGSPMLLEFITLGHFSRRALVLSYLGGKM